MKYKIVRVTKIVLLVHVLFIILYFEEISFLYFVINKCMTFLYSLSISTVEDHTCGP